VGQIYFKNKKKILIEEEYSGNERSPQINFREYCNGLIKKESIKAFKAKRKKEIFTEEKKGETIKTSIKRLAFESLNTLLNERQVIIEDRKTKRYYMMEIKRLTGQPSSNKGLQIIYNNFKIKKLRKGFDLRDLKIILARPNFLFLSTPQGSIKGILKINCKEDWKKDKLQHWDLRFSVEKEKKQKDKLFEKIEKFSKQEISIAT